ncbi:MAG: hypothetical protein HY908_30195 [Myxococcales bacterium]|nr:hypothetical protein [Myxococcales bacterium]
MTYPARSRTLPTAAVLFVAGCRFEPFANIAAGEGLQSSGPPPLAWEYGVRPPELRDGPTYQPVGTVEGSLAAPWKPLDFPAQSVRCYAVELGLGDGGAGTGGPLSDRVRGARPDLVLRAPGGEVVATFADRALVLCNWQGYPSLTVDLAGEPPVRGVLGRGRLFVRLHERELTKEERWELDARTTPFLAGRGVALRDPEGVQQQKGVRTTRELASFTPVALGPLAPAECNAVTVTLADDAHPNPEAKTFDAVFAFQIDGHTELPAHEVADGALVGKEICNPSGTAAELSLALVPRAGAPAPGTGLVTIEAYARPMHLLAARTRFGAGVLAPPPGQAFAPVGAPEERRLESFAPVELRVPSGACQAVEVHLEDGVVLDPAATLHSHYFVYADTKGDWRPLAQWEENGHMVARPFCNASLGEPWPVRLELVSRTGQPPGRGAVRVQVLTRPGTKEDW